MFHVFSFVCFLIYGVNRRENLIAPFILPRPLSYLTRRNADYHVRVCASIVVLYRIPPRSKQIQMFNERDVDSDVCSSIYQSSAPGLKAADLPRQIDPEKISKHSGGAEPAKVFSKPSGLQSPLRPLRPLLMKSTFDSLLSGFPIDSQKGPSGHGIYVKHLPTCRTQIALTELDS